jgi:hypothetical protein
LTKCPLSLFFFLLNQLHHSLGDAYSTLLDFVVNAFFSLNSLFIHLMILIVRNAVYGPNNCIIYKLFVFF